MLAYKNKNLPDKIFSITIIVILNIVIPIFSYNFLEITKKWLCNYDLI